MAAPTVQATNVVVSNIAQTTATLTVTAGDGAKRVFFVAKTNGTTNVDTFAVDATTYTANTDFSGVFPAVIVDGSAVTWYPVYNNNLATVNITGLSAGFTYRVHVIEYNGAAGAEQYLDDTATGNPASFSTLSSQGMMMSRAHRSRRGF